MQTRPVILMRHTFPSLVVFLTHAIGYHYFDIYSRWPLIDIPIHLVGGISIAYFWYGIHKLIPESYKQLSTKLYNRSLFILVMSAVSTLIWEFYEFFSDYLLSTQLQAGPIDTISDIGIGLIGVIITIVITKSKYYNTQSYETSKRNNSKDERNVEHG